jgi:hypothetical protein
MTTGVWVIVLAAAYLAAGCALAMVVGGFIIDLGAGGAAG